MDAVYSSKTLVYNQNTRSPTIQKTKIKSITFVHAEVMHFSLLTVKGLKVWKTKRANIFLFPQEIKSIRELHNLCNKCRESKYC
jgi:hypothetical protein